MAYDLKAVFKIQDNATAAINRITQRMQQLNNVMKQVERASVRLNSAQRASTGGMNSYNNTVNRNTSTINRNRTAINNINNTINRNNSVVNNNTTVINQNSNASNRAATSTRNHANALSGLKSQLLGIAGAYLGAQGAAKLYESTLGAASKYEASKVAIEAIFNEKSLSDSYLKVVEKMAIDSPLLNSSEMLGASKGLVAMTKNVDDLGKSWSIIEKLMVLDPTQGTEGAAFALKEMFQGDSLSMVERFGLSKGKLNEIKKLGIPEQIAAITALLDGMGITQEAVSKMGNTTAGRWAQIEERAQGFMKALGNSGNSKIGEALGSIIEAFDNMDMTKVISSIDGVIGGFVQKVIDVAKWLWEWREPIIDAIKVVGTFVTVISGILAVKATIAIIGAAIAFLTSPLGLVALAITGVILGFKTLYEKSETFRNAIDGITAKATELYEAFKSGGTSGLIDSLFPPDTAVKINSFVDGIKAKASELMNAFTEGGVMGVLSSLLPPGVVEEITSFVNTIKTQIGEVIPFLTEKFEQIKPSFDTLAQVFTKIGAVATQVFSVLWSVIEPILTNLWSLIQKVADIATWAFNLIIVPALAYVGAAFTAVWAILGPILQFIGAAIQLAFGVLKIVWDTIVAPFATFLMGGFALAINAAIPIIESIGAVFETIGSWISKAADLLSGFAKKLSSVKVPDWMGKVGGGVMNFASNVFGGGKKDGSHFNGIGRIPFDNYLATLHVGERVLNRFEADKYDDILSGGEMQGSGVNDFKYAGTSQSVTNTTVNNSTTNNNNAKSTQSMPSISIAKLADHITVREDADITRIADGIVAKILEKRGVTA